MRSASDTTTRSGNLTLILAGWNSSLGNRPFTDKKGAAGSASTVLREFRLENYQKSPGSATIDWTPEELPQATGATG